MSAGTVSTVEWCWICLQDQVKSLAKKRVGGVAMCPGCYHAYADQPDVLAHAVDYYRRHPPQEDTTKIERFGRELDEWGGRLPLPPVKRLCLCGCKEEVPEGKTCVDGHSAKVVAPELEFVPPKVEEKKPVKSITPVPEPEPELAEQLEQVLQESGKREIEQDEEPEMEKKDALEKVGVDVSAALKRYMAGESLDDLAKSLKIPKWRFFQSTKWKEARNAAEARQPREDMPKATKRKPHRKKAAVSEPAGVQTAEPEPAELHAPLVHATAEPALVGVSATQPEPKNHVRFILFDAQVSDTNLSEILAAIQKAIQGKA